MLGVVGLSVPDEGNRVSAATPQQAVCSQVMHNIQPESPPNLGRMAEQLDGPVPK
jgi:hypothetical protein